MRPVRESQRRDEVRREVSDEGLSLQQTGMVAVADLVVAPVLTHHHPRVLARLLQLRHPVLVEGCGGGSDDADLELAPLTGKRVQPPVSAPSTAGV